MIRATWADGLTLDVRLRRRWFPWPTDNVTFGRTIFSRSKEVNAATLRHELAHVRQYHERGWWWVLTNPRAREAEAHTYESAAWPRWENVR
ncbi:MAG: hypothetical protein IT352_07495 [Gemmatimonadales bacterium]|nr:hypothetical protein [Gemmatimonadales bacterium]